MPSRALDSADDSRQRCAHELWLDAHPERQRFRFELDESTEVRRLPKLHPFHDELDLRAEHGHESVPELGDAHVPVDDAPS